MKETSLLFDGINPTIYLRWIQVLKDYFDAKEFLDGESFMIATKKLKGYAQH